MQINPSTGLLTWTPDQVRRVTVTDALVDTGATMLVVSHHIPSTMRMADRVLLLLPHGAVAGAPAELRASADRRVTAFLNEEPEDAGEPEEEVDAPPAGRAAKGGRW